MAKKARKAKKARAAGGFKPSSLTAYERYQALSPILSQGAKTYMKLFETDHHSDSSSPRVIQATKARLDDMFVKVARDSGMSVEETRRAFHGFVQLGWSGLLTPIPLSAEQMAQDFVGTYELEARYTNGGNTSNARAATATTRARASMYFQQVPGTTNELIELQVMWNEENHFSREVAVKAFFDGKGSDSETFLIAAIMRTKLQQIDPYTVEISNEGEIIGNHGPYRDPISFSGSVQIGSFDGSYSMLRIQDGEQCQARQRGKSVPVAGMFLLLNVQSVDRTVSYKMSGLPDTNGVRSMDVADVYTKVSNQQPLIGGWEPLEDYFNRVRGYIVGARPTRQRLADFDISSPIRRPAR